MWRELHSSCEIRCDLKTKKKRFWEFFHLQGGKLRNPTTKPRLTDTHIIRRFMELKKWVSIIQNTPTLRYCFLDEKWLYTTSRRRKEKHLPRASFENLKDTFIKAKKVRSRPSL